jgi:hypothetical protein
VGCVKIGAWDKQYKTRIDTGKTRIDTDWCKLVLRSVNFTAQACSCSTRPTLPCPHGWCSLPRVTIVDRVNRALLHVNQRSTHTGAHVCTPAGSWGAKLRSMVDCIYVWMMSRRSSTRTKCLVTTRRPAHQSVLCRWSMLCARLSQHLTWIAFGALILRRHRAQMRQTVCALCCTCARVRLWTSVLQWRNWTSQVFSPFLWSSQRRWQGSTAYGCWQVAQVGGQPSCCKQLIADLVCIDKKFTDFNLHKVYKSTTQQIDVNQEPCTSINSWTCTYNRLTAYLLCL